MKILIFLIFCVVASSAFEAKSDTANFCQITFESRRACGCFIMSGLQVITSAKCIGDLNEQASVQYSKNSEIFTVKVVKISLPDEIYGKSVKDIALIELNGQIDIDEETRKEEFLKSQILSGSEARAYVKENILDATFRTFALGAKNEIRSVDLEFIDPKSEGCLNPDNNEEALCMKSSNVLGDDEYLGGPIVVSSRRACYIIIRTRYYLDLFFFEILLYTDYTVIQVPC